MRFTALALGLLSCGAFLTSAMPLGPRNDSISNTLQNSQLAYRDFNYDNNLVKRTRSAKDEKCQKEMARKSSQDILHRRTLTSLDKKYWEAVGALGAACHKLNIRYFFLGGTAVTALGAGRTTRDIDVVIDDMDQHAANLVTELNGRLKGTTDSYGCVEYTMDGISADLFDLPSWPQHEDWKNIINAPYPIQLPQTGETVNIPHPRQLLSDKQRAAAERVNNKKGPQDATDVVFLQQYVQQHHPA